MSFPEHPQILVLPTQALVLDRTPHTNPPQRVSPFSPLTGNHHQTWHTHTSTPIQAVNTRGTPTSVQSASPNLPRTPAQLAFSTSAVDRYRLGLGTQAIDQYQQSLSSGSRVSYRPIPNPAASVAYPRGLMPGQLMPTDTHPWTQTIWNQTMPTSSAKHRRLCSSTHASSTKSIVTDDQPDHTYQVN